MQAEQATPGMEEEMLASQEAELGGENIEDNPPNV